MVVVCVLFVSKLYEMVRNMHVTKRCSGMLPEGVPEINFECLQLPKGLEGRLGKGAHGFVVKAHLVSGTTTLPVAVKKVDLGDSSARLAEMKELAALAKLRHKNIVHLLGACVNADTLHVVLELCPLGALSQVLLVLRGDEADLAVQERAASLLAAAGWSTGGRGRAEGVEVVKEARQMLEELLGGVLGAGANSAFYRVTLAVAKALAYIHEQVRSFVSSFASLPPVGALVF